VVDLDATFGQQFLDIAVGQAVTQVPAHRDRDHLPREAVAGRSRRSRPWADHPASLRQPDDHPQRNSADPPKRDALLADSLASDGVYLDNSYRADGPQALSTLIQTFMTESLPGGSIVLITNVDAHDGFARFSWAANDASGIEVLIGTDFVQFNHDGLIEKIVGFYGPLTSP